LAVFTERRSALLFEPIEVCTGYNEIDTALANLDWRMAWAADSRIHQGLYQTLTMLAPLNVPVVFLTDGQEAPPANPRYLNNLAELKGKVRGMVVGVGGLEPAAIPKFNQKGEPDGVYRPDDVPHRTTFGESDLNPERIAGYNARNAPFGDAPAASTEHLSALKETYLRQLSLQAGFGYHRLATAHELVQALQHPDFTSLQQRPVDVRWQAAGMALLLCAAGYLPHVNINFYYFVAMRAAVWRRSRVMGKIFGLVRE
jgi:mxaL protein